ncbi:MAG TPA: flagellar basal-body MS-ring/collar protein FliF [Nitrosospira sp.]|nr:flagellar basal-body MS-ring/collar protein FliF [Nitrosospira sp.]
MAVDTETVTISGSQGFMRSFLGRISSQQKIVLMLASSTIIALAAGGWMWGKTPDYKVLFSNISDRDGGAIVVALQQMNVPYKFAEGGAAILVPDSQVHDVRLKLASQGLPKGGLVGFELMENQKFGTSQFLEQVNFNRAVEGELARSIQSLSAVSSARVHLAVPKQSVFMREQPKPSASVLVNLHPGRTLDAQQVSAVAHLVSSSVPNLPLKNVTVVDQHGNLLSHTDDPSTNNGLDPGQLKYMHAVERSYIERIEAILSPIVGRENVRAQVTADIDFAQSEHTSEMYKPNQNPGDSAVRSQQTSESSTRPGAGEGGVPGALSNQPPAPATAPVTTPPGTPAPAPDSAPPPAPPNTRKDATINYEVDKTIQHTRKPVGSIKRMSVAVVVNYRKITDQNGASSTKPLTEAEKAQITDLVKEAMGFNNERGDTLNVVNSPFADIEREALPEAPLWKQPEMIDLAQQVGKMLLIGGLILYVILGVLRPTLKRINHPPAPVLAAPTNESHSEVIPAAVMPSPPLISQHEQNLAMARQLAKDDPKRVANVVKQWVIGE